jgi:hypothetical protein
LRHVPVGDDRLPLGSDPDLVGYIGAAHARKRWSQRSVWTGFRRGIRHGRQRFRVELHNVDSGRSEGDRQQHARYDIPERN